MKLVINNCFGGFGIPDELAHELGTKHTWDVERTNPRLIEYVENHPATDEDYSFGTSLVVVEIPDEATDYMVTEYDGAESVYYVLNGKIHVI